MIGKNIGGIAVNGMDYVLLWAITILLFFSAGMKIKLGEKKNSPYGLGWKIQLFVFPVLMALALICACFGVYTLVIPAIFLGIIEEFICWCIRKKK